ncbi:MAG: YwiC-like family protein [Arachnia sp.]
MNDSAGVTMSRRNQQHTLSKPNSEPSGQASSPRPRARPSGRRPKAGWVPNQHGAWAMLVTPYALGAVWAAVHGRMDVGVVLLLPFWVVGYFAFFAVSQWLKSGLKPRFVAASLTYLCLAGVLGLAVVLLRPSWLWWIGAFAPLAAVALWSSWRRRERSLLSGGVTVAVACLLPLVIATPGPGVQVPLGLAAVCFAYFFGTVLYVKTMIRERDSRGYLVLSVAWHGAWIAGVWALPGMVTWPLSLLFGLLAVRSALVPWLARRRGIRPSPKAVGIGEVVATLGLVGASLPSILA